MTPEFIMNNYLIESFSLGFIAGITVSFCIICAIFSKNPESNKSLEIQEG